MQKDHRFKERSASNFSFAPPFFRHRRPPRKISATPNPSAMDFWQRARVFADEAAKMSQEISKEAAKKSQEVARFSQEFVSETAKKSQDVARFSQEFVSETAKKSKEFAVEASRKADQVKTEAMKRADQIRTFAGEIEIPIPLSPLADGSKEMPPADLEKFGVTEELREFVKGIIISTFRDFPMEDKPEMSDVPTVSNVRQDLNEWQANHATLVLTSVKEISKFRYELCPRHMKEKKFWRIYFVLVNNYVAPYEKQYMENLIVETVEQNTDPASTSTLDLKETKPESKTSTSSTAEHDLDVFLLGDLGSSDEDPDDGDGEFDDDFDKIGNNSGLDSDDDGRKSKQSSKAAD